VDGDEFFYGSDPLNYNTDSDRRNDREDIEAELSPTIEDFLVTVMYQSIGSTQNGDVEGPGEWGFDLAVRTPDDSTPTGLSAELTHAVVERVNLTNPFLFTEVSRSDIGVPFTTADGHFGVYMNDSDQIVFARVLTVQQRSVTFAMARHQRFSIEGVVVEWDGAEDDNDGTTAIATEIYFGGLEGLVATMDNKQIHRGVFEGAEVSGQIVEQLVFWFGEGNNFPINNNVPSAARIAGAVSVMYIVN